MPGGCQLSSHWVGEVWSRWLGDLSQLTLVGPPLFSVEEPGGGLGAPSPSRGPVGIPGAGWRREGDVQLLPLPWTDGPWGHRASSLPARGLALPAVPARSPPPRWLGRRSWSRARKSQAARAGASLARSPEPTRSARRWPGRAGERPGPALRPARPPRPASGRNVTDARLRPGAVLAPLPGLGLTRLGGFRRGLRSPHSPLGHPSTPR
jgi:hypothetical protein